MLDVLVELSGRFRSSPKLVLTENEVRMSSLWYDRGELETCWWLELNARIPTQTRSSDSLEAANERICQVNKTW